MRVGWILGPAAGLLLSVGGPGAFALTLPVSSPGPLGLDLGFACPDGSASCPTAATFDLDATADATGTVTITGALFDGNLVTVDVTVTVLSSSFSGSAPGVDQLVFTSTTYTAAGVSALVTDDFNGGWNLLGLGASASGSVSGSLEQLLLGGNVSGPAAFSDLTALLTNLNCTIDQATTLGQCGFSFGALGDFTLNSGTGGGVNLDHVHTFNVAVPEPMTLAMLCAGLLAMAGWVERRRS
jgi:hypothetical protein